MEMTPQRWSYTNAYLRGVFGDQDEQLRTLMMRAVAAGLPDIAVSADVGRLLMILASMAGGNAGARGARPKIGVELGTLAGYSGIWIARGLGEGSRLITVEPEPRHADFARREFAAAGVGDRVEIREGTALEVLPQLRSELGPGSVDFLFIDAIKREYPAYYREARDLIAPGGLIVADNVLGAGNWWIDESPGANPDRDGADEFNRLLAADAEFEAVAVPIREGVLIARRQG